MQNVSVSIVVPVYCDGVSLRELWRRLHHTLNDRYPDFELLLIDDGSPDDTWSIVEELAAKDQRVKGLRLSRNFGQHPAIAAGFDSARGEVIILMDADLEDRPEDLPQLVERLGPNVDVVYTIKAGQREGLFQRITSIAFHFAFSRISRTDVPMNVGTLRAFKRKVLRAINEYKEHNVLFGPLMFYIGFPSEFVEVNRETRQSGQSRYTFRKRLSLAARSLASYTNLPHQVFVWVGGFIVLGCGIYALAIMVQYFALGQRLPPGLTLVALLLFLFMGVTLASLGVIGTYVFRVYQEVLARPRYQISERLNEKPDDPA